MNPSLALSFFTILILNLLSLSFIDASVEEACKAAASSSPNVDYGFCVTSLRCDPRSRAADSKGLAVIAARLSAANATSTSAKISELVKKAKDSSMKACLDDCSSLYSDLVPTLDESRAAIKSGRYGDAKTYLSAAMDQPTTCEDGFSEMGVSSPLTKENNDTRGLSAIALAITCSLG